MSLTNRENMSLNHKVSQNRGCMPVIERLATLHTILITLHIISIPPETTMVAPVQQRKRTSNASTSRMSKNVFRFSTKLNSDYKWKSDDSVVGALQVPYDGFRLNARGTMKQKQVAAKEEEFQECLSLWKDRKLQQSFSQACEGVPPSTSCFGLVADHNRTVKEMAALLNKGWTKSINKQLKNRGYKVSCFAWSWNNAHGKGKTSVLLVRFHALSIRRLSTVASKLEHSDSTLAETVLELERTLRENHSQEEQPTTTTAVTA